MADSAAGMGLAEAAMGSMPGGDEAPMDDPMAMDDSFGIVAQEAYDAMKKGSPETFADALRACIESVLTSG